MKSKSIRVVFSKRGHFAAWMLCLSFTINLAACTAPEDNDNQNQNQNSDNTNDNGDVQLDGFAYDVELGRSGMLALPVENCVPPGIGTTGVGTITGTGSFDSMVVTSETVAQPYVHMQVTAPKGTDGGVIIANCGLQGRFAMTPGSGGETTATADLTANIRIDADQNGEAAPGFTYAISVSLVRVSSTMPDVTPPTDLGTAERMYCTAPLTCEAPLPSGDGLAGMERIGLSLSNIDLSANAEYIVYVAAAAGIVSSAESPDTLGGSVIVRATVESLELNFNNDDSGDP